MSPLPGSIEYLYHWYMSRVLFWFYGQKREVNHSGTIQLGALPPFLFSIHVLMGSPPPFPYILYSGSFESACTPLFDQLHICGRSSCTEFIALLMMRGYVMDKHFRLCFIVLPFTLSLCFLLYKWKVCRSTYFSEALPPRGYASIWVVWLILRFISYVAITWVIVWWNSLEWATFNCGDLKLICWG